MMLSTAQLTAILDKMTRYAGEVVGDQEINSGFTAGMQTANTDCLPALAAYVIATTDEDIMADLLPSARVLHESPPVPTDLKLTSLAKVMAFMTGLEAHYKFFGYKGLNDYLTTLNGTTGMTPTLRAHQHFRKYYGIISALNSFIPVDLPICNYVIGATNPLGPLASISKSNTAGAKFVLRNNGALNTSGPAVTVTAVKIDGTIATLTATIVTLTDAHETNLSDTTKVFANVSAITVVGGTAADQFQVVAKTDRSVASA